MTPGETLKELFGGGCLESRLGLWSIKVVVVGGGATLLLYSSLTFSVCALTLSRLLGGNLAWKWLAFYPSYLWFLASPLM